jgi:hypothetical protein
MQPVSPDKRAQRKYSVEVLTEEGLWAQHGAHLDSAQSTAAPSDEHFHWHRFGRWSAGTLFSICLHGALFSTVLWGTAGRPPLRPLTEGASASQQNHQGTEYVSTLILLNDHSITPPDQVADDSVYESLPSSAKPTSDSLIVAALDTPAPAMLSGSDTGTDDTAPTAEATGNEAGRAVLFGRYMGQIRARIERAWDYPVTPVAATFDCKVQIKQTIHGDVQEVTLQHCGDDPAWQTSLVHAIQRASPLSAPPDQSVFTELVTLNFGATKLAANNSDAVMTSSP